MIVAFVGIFVAIGLGVVALLRPAAQAAAAAETAPKYSDQQVAEAKKTVCDGHDLASRVNRSAGTKSSDVPGLRFGIAHNIRLGGSAMGEYMLALPGENPATPGTLADSVRKFAMASQETTLLQIADTDEAELNTTCKKIDAAAAEVAQACK